ncbi:MAG: bifunctional riboflavin kinase/FAD synthetase [Gemmatimonadetes bacterium]|nr:bifunctional riboflavin kinase/FAD synthetase [Gemmatimonadota bacterium]
MSRTVVTVGTFDGVHRGHWAVLEEIARRAQASGLTSVLVTFEPHPLEIVNPQAAPPLLTLADEKRLVLAQSAVDRVAFVPFTHALRDYPPERFVREILEERFHIAELVIGYDHGFGRGRAGDVGLLRAIGKEDGFAVDVVPAVMLDGRPISSTMIRRFVAGGDLDHAARALGRPYSASGAVVPGAGRGREIGIPTVNLAPPHPRKLLPPDGVYAATVAWRGGLRGAMLNLGPRPTFGEHARALEAHLFGFDGDLYGETVTVEFHRRLRDTARFASVDGLRRQLEQDRRDALDALRMVGRPVTL